MFGSLLSIVLVSIAVGLEAWLFHDCNDPLKNWLNFAARMNDLVLFNFFDSRCSVGRSMVVA